MPQYTFKCPFCGEKKRTIMEPEEVKEAQVECLKCGGLTVRDAPSPTTQITETLDNGAMVRRLERLADAEKIFHERAHGKKGNI